MIKIGIVYGGRSTEHDASIKSKENFENNLDREKFSIIDLVFIDRYGKIFLNDIEITFGKLIDRVKENTDIFYLNLLHGQEGEDGSWCGVFDICDGRGSFEKVNTSSILMNKYQQSAVVAFHCKNIEIPKSILLKREDNIQNIKSMINSLSKDEFIVKPNTMGASHFTQKFNKNSFDDAYNLIKKIFDYDKNVIVQEFICGEEYTCGVIKYNNKNEVLPIIHVKSNSSFLDHVSKHKHGNTKCDFNDFSQKEIVQKKSLELFELFNVIGMCRFDFLIDKSGKIYFLEGNLIPGFSNGSAFPMMLDKKNITLSDFTEQLVNTYDNEDKRNKYLPYEID